MQKTILLTAAIMGVLAVGIGAFGAHGLKEVLAKNGTLAFFETGVKYHFYHALALLLVGVLMFHVQDKYLMYAAYSFVFGVVVFSGSLYGLSISNIRILGAITPIGGLGLIAGWVFLGFGVYREL